MLQNKITSMLTRGIWMAEDDPDDRLIYRDILQKMRISEPLMFFPNGKTVLAELLNPSVVPPRLLILDGMMPLLSGWEVVEKVRHSSRLAQMRIVLLTGSFSIRDQVKSDEYNIQAEQKPSRLREVEDLFKKILLNVFAEQN